ncbi:M23 family metallopeptidase [Rhodobacteraceae bacterium CCMM004]|nr:M23 family metallopeptidase [Rhodobacteraceae bacterium CCMM004]
MTAILSGRAALMSAALAVAGCGQTGFDFDLRDALGPGALDTTEAVVARVAERPRPDSRGVLSYPNYQVAVARRGDTTATVAARVGLPAAELARYNGSRTDTPLRRGEVVALPRRVAEPSPATGAATPGPIVPVPPAGPVTQAPLDVDARASAAIDRADSDRARRETGPTRTGTEPIRHKVASGETAYSISRRYGVPVDALAEWNGLGRERVIRVGQFLLIPVVETAPAPGAATAAPGAGSRAPVPPSAATPLPGEDETTDRPKETPPSPDLGTTATAASASDARFVFPVTGSIIRPYAKGRNDGIDIAAPAGTVVRAADAGVVAAITRDTDQIPILVLRHADNILTVYAGVDEIAVEKGDRVRRGQSIATVRAGNPSALHFEVREGFDSVDPEPYLN